MSIEKRIIISGGGTGGHIFPAISIANEIMKKDPQAQILFVGALGKMEMERVPQAGYNIEGLPVAGLKRKLSFSNLLLPFKVLRSLKIAGNIIERFKPQVVVGVGSVVGLRVGSVVGLCVGSVVGLCVGSGVGTGVGTALGSAVGPGVGTGVGIGAGTGAEELDAEVGNTSNTPNSAFV